MLGLLKRRAFLLATLAASLGVPYAMFNPQAKTQIDSLRKSLPAVPSLTSLASSSPSTTVETASNVNPSIRPTTVTTSAASEPPHGTAANASSPSPDNTRPATHTVSLPDQLEGPPVQDFGEVLRFDVTSRWITSRWSRVSTVLSEYDLEGLRVPFVSGTRLDDVAGSLTYYFDRRHRLQRITFDGLTGDERRLAGFLKQAYGMHPEASLYAGLYAAKWNGQLKSALIVRHAPVITSDAPYRQFEVHLEINRPDEYYQLSEPVRKELERGRHNSRWGL